MSEPLGFSKEIAEIFNSKLGQSIVKAYEAGEKRERERIIKLLEAWWETDDELWQVIALIKGEGENK